MREIKFRAWVKRKNELIYLKGFRYSGNEKIKITFADEDEDDCTYTFLNKDVVLEQFTGLHDKNGVEIYEGDIVKCVSELFSNFGKYPTGEYATEYYEICSINGDRSYCFGTRKLNRDYVSKDILKSVAEKYYEVIGNIYENSDLFGGATT